MEEYKISVASILSYIEKYLPVLNKYDYKKGTGTIYLTHLHQLFDLQKELKELDLNTTFTPILIISNGEISIYDDYIE